jgi:hypothetical protein
MLEAADATLTKVQKNQILQLILEQTVLPGHGVPGGPEVMAGQAQFMVELRKAVQSAVDQGGKPTDLAKLQLPDSVKNWVGDGLAAQAKDAYEEITQGKPHGEILGGK